MRLCLVLLAAAAAAKRQQPPPPITDDRQLFREALQERDFKTALKTAPAAYATWWQQLLKDDPYHVFIETLLIFFLLYLLYGTRRAKNSQKKEQALTDREIDDLVKDWAPAPLVERSPPVLLGRGQGQHPEASHLSSAALCCPSASAANPGCPAAEV